MHTTLDRGIFTIAAVLTPAECQAYIDWSEGIGFEAAPISTGSGFVMRPDIRNNARVMVDDPERAARIWSRVSADVPATMMGRQAVGLNERLRFYRYAPGQEDLFAIYQAVAWSLPCE